MAGQEKWYFTREQLMNSASRKCGLDPDKELAYRQQAANLIQDMGQRLQVTQLCINTAIVYMHRFYAFHSFTQFHRNSIAAAALFLAAKVEEQPRKLEYVIKVAHVCLHRTEATTSLDPRSEHYQELAQDLVFNENVLLQTLGFDVAIDHPHTHVVRTCHLVKAPKDLAQTSYFMASNSLHLTTMCLQYRPTVVACFCIHLATKWSNWAIPQSNEGRHWFQYVDRSVTTELLERLTAEFLYIFDKCPSRLKKKMMSMSNNPPPSSGSGQNPKMQDDGSFDRDYEREKRRIVQPGGYVPAHSTHAQPHASQSQTHPSQAQAHSSQSQAHSSQAQAHSAQSQAHSSQSQAHRSQPQSESSQPHPPQQHPPQSHHPHPNKIDLREYREREKKERELRLSQQQQHAAAQPRVPGQPSHKPHHSHRQHPSSQSASSSSSSRPPSSSASSEAPAAPQPRARPPSLFSPENTTAPHQAREIASSRRPNIPQSNTSTTASSHSTSHHHQPQQHRKPQMQPHFTPSAAQQQQTQQPAASVPPQSLHPHRERPALTANPAKRPLPQQNVGEPAANAVMMQSSSMKRPAPPLSAAQLDAPSPAKKPSRLRTGSSSSEPELVPVVKKLEDTPQYDKLLQSRSSISHTTPNIPKLPQLTQPKEAPPVSRAPAPVNGIETNPALVSNLLKESLLRAPPPIIVPQSTISEASSRSAPKPAPVAAPQPPPPAPIAQPPAPVVAPPPHEEKQHKSEKKKKKEKHKHKDRSKDSDRKKHKKDKDREKSKHKEPPPLMGTLMAPVPALTAPSPALNSGLKIKIPKERLAAPPSYPPSLKLKIPKDVLRPGHPSSSSSSASNGQHKVSMFQHLQPEFHPMHQPMFTHFWPPPLHMPPPHQHFAFAPVQVPPPPPPPRVPPPRPPPPPPD